MRTVITLLIVGVLIAGVTSQVVAIPNCVQITDGWCDMWCSPDDGWIDWRPCDPQIRQWRCECEMGGSEPSPWTYCYCEGYEPPGNGCDCLLAGTLIKMADGSTKPIETVRAGDQVIAYSDLTTNLKTSEVVSVHAPYNVEYYFIINKQIRITENHPVMSNGSWISVGELKVGDVLLEDSGSDLQIYSIERIEEKAMVYNIQVVDGTYVANGIVVHNKEDCEDYCPVPKP